MLRVNECDRSWTEGSNRKKKGKTKTECEENADGDMRTSGHKDKRYFYQGIDWVEFWEIRKRKPEVV